MSIERLTRSDGRVTYVVRWYDGGRGSAKRKRTFDRRKDAEFFEASLRRARQLGQLSSEVIGSGATLEEFLVEWWDTYAATHLRPGTLATYSYLLDKWIVPYLGRKRLRDINRETIDSYAAALRADGAGVPTINRTLGLLQGAFHRAVEWRRLQWNPVLCVRRLTHVRDEAIDAGTPETVEAIRRQLEPADAALVSVLAYEGLRPGEVVRTPLARCRRRPRPRPAQAARPAGDLRRAALRDQVTTRPTARVVRLDREGLVDLYVAAGRPSPFELVFRDSEGGYHRRQNWRRRVWIPALERAGVAYFCTYDLRHTCATLLIYGGRTVNEVADHLGHADPGFTARTYAHIMRDGSKRRRVSITRGITKARRPPVDPSTPDADSSTADSNGKVLQIERADARIRTADPFITSCPSGVSARFGVAGIKP